MRKRIRDAVISILIIAGISWFIMSLNNFFLSTEKMFYKSAEGMHLGKIEEIVFSHEYTDGSGMIAGTFDSGNGGIYIMGYRTYYKYFVIGTGGEILPSSDSFFDTGEDIILSIDRWSMKRDEGGVILGYSQNPAIDKVIFHYHGWTGEDGMWYDFPIVFERCAEVDRNGFFSVWYEAEDMAEQNNWSVGYIPDCVIGVDKDGNIIWHEEEYDVYKHFEKELAELNK